MSITYALRESKISPDSGYTAQTVTQGTATEDDLIARLLKRGSTLTEADLRAVFALLPSVIADVVAEGRTVNTGFANYGVSITGSFASPDTAFDPSRHQVVARLQPGQKLAKLLADQTRVERVAAARPEPRIQAVTDATTQTVNQRFTAGAPVRLSGTGLKFDAKAADEGVFFQKGTAAAVRATVVVRNMPGEIIVVAPAGVTGPDWRVEVRNRHHKGTDLRAGVAPSLLDVA
ncbi:DNA-binding domain-containing protein [Hymenobacter sp. B81]|uniref:HU family DNA-binding protein n=1 Tax=Hymenobacter sp. B81 TaxID=3344878 RepID=UPI0037DDD46B